METFPLAVVKELRDRANRYRLRVRTLESVLMKRALRDAATMADVELPEVTQTNLSGIYVDEFGNVLGADKVISSLKLQSEI